MCCQSFWKRITIFCLALGIGILASNFLSLQESPESKKMKNLPFKEKNCAYADKNLKYETLPLKKKVYNAPQVEEKPEIKLIPFEKEKLETPKIETKQNNFSESVPQLHIPLQSTAQYQTLLHKENCYESDEKK